MASIPEISTIYVPQAHFSGFPFDSTAHDALLANGFRCRSLLNGIIRLSEKSQVSYYEVLHGQGYFYNDLDFDDNDVRNAVYERRNNIDCSLRVFLIPQNTSTRRRAFEISRSAFESLLKESEIPVRFLEVLANNNGCYQAYTTYSETRAECFREATDLLIKLPASFLLNSAIYIRYTIHTENTVCLLLGNQLYEVKKAMEQLFVPPFRRTASPMQVIDTAVSEYVALMEPQRQSLDVRVRELEAKTGMGAHVFDESQRAAANELNDLLKDLHVCEGLLAFFERTVQFQVGWIEWLQSQHSVLNQLRFGAREISNLPPLHRPAEEGVASSLGLCASLSRESFEQVRTLRNRIRIQLSVSKVANLIAQNDSRTNISIADASRRIAFETRRDSDAMKTIAALTMVFLPATFVATLFGMVFFTVDSDSGSHFRVNPLWWIYLVVTIPLTLLTVGVWRGWLSMVRRLRIQDEESLGLKEKSQ
ncbi:MAG: hypothetical protein Q9166_006197 [cf. Caloplaca sp. 2 TL-2023]